MNLLYITSSIAILLGAIMPQSAFCGCTHGMSPGRPQLPEDERKSLTDDEASAILKSISNGLRTCVLESGPFAKRRGIAVPKEVIELHKRKRLVTLQVFVAIVRTGRPKDAITAVGLALALERNPVAGVSYAHFPLRDFDQAEDQNTPTTRAELVELLEELLLAAEKQLKGGK